MEKNKKVTLVVIAAVVALAAVGGGGYTVWHKHQVSLAAAKLATDDGAASINGGDTTVAEQQTASAGGSGSSASGSGVLSAHSANGAVGSNSNMGQLLPAQHQQSAGSSSSSSSSGVSNPFDPTTFEQYEKYKSGNQALFGDAQKGTGDELTEGKKAAVYYRGWLTNGQLFDESRAGSDGKLQPFVFQMGAHQVIAGWEQALTGMKVGGVRLVVVPPAVGYGAQAQASIPANSVLIFQVQLAAVQ